MKCAIRADVVTKCGGIEIGPEGVITDETPEILYFIAMGWVKRVVEKSDAVAEPVAVPAVDSVPAVVKSKRTR